jgi:hypothetical protein
MKTNNREPPSPGGLSYADPSVSSRRSDDLGLRHFRQRRATAGNLRRQLPKLNVVGSIPIAPRHI